MKYVNKYGILLMLWALWGICSLPGWAHGDEPHGKKDTTAQQVQPSDDDANAEVASAHTHTSMPTVEGAAGISDFPTLHPLIVHVPIVLIPIALLLQLLVLFSRKEGLDWAVWLTLLLGLLGAWIAGRYVHPHTHGLTDQAQWVLDQHDLYADWTVWLALVAAILKGAAVFLRKQILALEISVWIVLAGASWSVFHAGHYGAQLVHIEGVGPQGKYLELEDNH